MYGTKGKHYVYYLAQLQKLNDNDENVYCKNIIDRYAARPQILEDMSLAEFAANYTYKRETTNDATQYEDDMSEESDTELQCDDDFSEQSIINLQNGLGCMRKRKKSYNKMAQLQHRKRT